MNIGIVDWGIGGLSVYRALGLGTAAVYLSDCGNTPYGKQTRDGMRQRFLQLAAFFEAREVSTVLVACHAASSALEGAVEWFQGVAFHSIAPALRQAAAHARGPRVGVIGGRLTIESGVYGDLGSRFFFQVAQPLSALVEAGRDPVEEEVLLAVAAVLEEMPAMDSLLLACTHYPALIPAFAQLLPGVELLDPAGWMVQGIEVCPGPLQFHTTGPGGDSRRAAQRAFGIDIGEPVEMELDLRC